jgi:hypothetical protein
MTSPRWNLILHTHVQSLFPRHEYVAIFSLSRFVGWTIANSRFAPDH